MVSYLFCFKTTLTDLKNLAAFAIYLEIYTVRLDVACAAHSHSVYGRAFCATGRTLDMLTQDSCVFYKDHVLYEYVGLPA